MRTVASSFSPNRRKKAAAFRVQLGHIFSFLVNKYSRDMLKKIDKHVKEGEIINGSFLVS